jgi:hypothetical protein
MNTVVLTRPEFAFIVATRGILGVGIGLLVAGRLNGEQRRSVGRALLAIGLATTIPAALAVFGKRREVHELPARAHSHDML